MSRLLRSLLRRGRPEREPGGVVDGRLADCPRAPCCVSSQASEASNRIDPIAFDGPAAPMRDRLLAVLEGWPGTRIVRAEERYLHVECTTSLIGFVDDVEISIDEEAGLVHLRSCSRIGYSDLGTNRRRMEALRRTLRETDAS